MVAVVVVVFFIEVASIFIKAAWVGQDGVGRCKEEEERD